MATMLPVGNAVATVLHGVAAAMKAVALAGLALVVSGALRAYFQGISLSAGIAQAALASLTKTLVTLISKSIIFTSMAWVVVFLGMAASVEAADREILGLIGATTPLQDALIKLGEAWRLWADFVAGDFFNMVGSGLGAVVTVLVEIIETIRYVNDLTGGWFRTIISVIGTAMTLYAMWKLIVYQLCYVKLIWSFIANSAIFKPVITILAAVVTKIGTCINSTVAWIGAQIGLNATMTYFLGLTLVGLAAVGIAIAATAAYTASQASAAEQAATATARWTNENDRLATSLDAAGQKSTAMLERLKQLADFSNDIKEKGPGVEERDMQRRQKIADAADPQRVGAATISAIMDNEIVPLMAAIGKNKAAILRASGNAANAAFVKEVQDTLEANEQKLEAVQKKLAKAQDTVKNIAPLDEADQALAHRERIEANLQDLGIDVIRTANEVYAEMLQNLNTALQKGWIDQEQYNRQVETATKTFQQNNPAIRARLEAEKRLADSMDQAAKSIIDSLKTPWMKFGEKTRQIDEFLQAGYLDKNTADAAHVQNVDSLKSSLGFADIKTPSEMLADELSNFAKLTKQVVLSETQIKRQMDKLAGDLAAATGIGDLFDALPEQQTKKLAAMLDGVDGLLAAGELTTAQAAQMREDAARKFVTDKSESKGPSYVVRGTTEAYQRDQEVLREARGGDKKLEELRKLLAEAELVRKEQEESRRTQEQIAENTGVLRNLKPAGV